MYSSLNLHPTFIFADETDVTETLIAEVQTREHKDCYNKQTLKNRFKMAPLLSSRFQEERDEELPPRLTSSATSIIKRPSSVLIRHSSLSNRESESFIKTLKRDIEPLRNECYKSDERNVKKLNRPQNPLPHRTQLKILAEIAEVKRARERRTKAEFLQFAKEFAKKCRLRPIDTLLNPMEYDSYIRTGSSKTKHFEGFEGVNTNVSNCSKIPFLRSSSPLIGLNVEEKIKVTGHVVGDLVSYATNTSRYFDNPDLSDVILLVGEQRFYAHKFALAAQSDIFLDMLLMTSRCADCPEFQKEIELNESKECQDVFASFLRFFYCGKITFTSDTALPLLVLSAKYRVEALRSACDSYITEMIEDGDLKSALRWLKYASVYQLHDLTVKCVDGAIADNLEELVESADWLSLTVDCVEAILRSSSLLVPHEFFLFEALQRWLINKRKTLDDEELIGCLRKTLPQIRFSQMQGTQLLAVEDSSVGIQFKSVVRSFLSDAYRFQILSKDCPEFQEPQYLPRDYTEKDSCVQFFYNPTRNKRILPSIYYGSGRWEIQPRRYYDTLNVVIVLKKPLENDIKVFISILIYKRNGTIHMRLRRKACVLRAVDTTPRPTALSGGLTSTSSTPGNSPRSNSSISSEPAKHKSNLLNPHRSLHGPPNKLHGPNNGQEYYAIDNIISDGDFQVAMSNAVANGLKLGVIIRTWGANLP